MSLRFAGVWPFGISRFARKMRPCPAFFGAFLCPVNFSAFHVECDTNAPLLHVLAGTRVTLTRIDKCFDFGSIQIRAHDSHAPRDPTSKACGFFLSSCSCLGVKVPPFGTMWLVFLPSMSARSMEPVISIGIAHVGPVEVTCFYIHDDAVGDPPSFTSNDLQVGAVRI